jgi:hypothetical protein
MENKLEPIWQSISNLPMIAYLIDGQFADSNEQYTRLLEACQKPYVLDDHTVQRVTYVYTEQLKFLWVFEKQLVKWKKEERLTPIQQSEIDRLQGYVQQLHNILTSILTLVENLKRETIEKVMKKSDLEMGTEFLKK